MSNVWEKLEHCWISASCRKWTNQIQYCWPWWVFPEYFIIFSLCKRTQDDLGTSCIVPNSCFDAWTWPSIPSRVCPCLHLCLHAWPCCFVWASWFPSLGPSTLFFLSWKLITLNLNHQFSSCHGKTDLRWCEVCEVTFTPHCCTHVSMIVQNN